MSSTANPFPEGVSPGEGSATDRSHFELAVRDSAAALSIASTATVLIVGGSHRDAYSLYRAGFRDITLSNIEPMADAERAPSPGLNLKIIYADIANLDLPSNSFDVVVAHEVLHHSYSPHRALLEMIRVSRRHIILMEPNDSAAMRALIRLRFSAPFEVTAVVANGFRKGGVENTSIPNYIYRWNPRALYQAVAAALPHANFSLRTRRFWDFNLNADQLSKRTGTRLGTLCRLLGPRTVLLILRLGQAVTNLIPPLAHQGNKFFACITKRDELKPWIVKHGDRYDFNRAYKA